MIVLSFTTVNVGWLTVPKFTAKAGPAAGSLLPLNPMPWMTTELPPAAVPVPGVTPVTMAPSVGSTQVNRSSGWSLDGPARAGARHHIDPRHRRSRARQQRIRKRLWRRRQREHRTVVVRVRVDVQQTHLVLLRTLRGRKRLPDRRDRLAVAPLRDVRHSQEDRSFHSTRLNCATPPE